MLHYVQLYMPCASQIQHGVGNGDLKNSVAGASVMEIRYWEVPDDMPIGIGHSHEYWRYA